MNEFERKKLEKNKKNPKSCRYLPKYLFHKKKIRPFSVNKENEYLQQPLQESLFMIFLDFFDSLAGASIGCKLSEDKKKI